jgi:group I intron endonuclease
VGQLGTPSWDALPSLTTILFYACKEVNMKEDIFKIYVIINQINGKKYFGQTSMNLKDRWKGKYNTHLESSINKYGKENFLYIVLLDGLTHKEADDIEKELIEDFNTRDPNFGYNIREGGSRGGLSDETKRKISEAAKHKKLTDATKEKIANSMRGEKNHFYGKNHSEETKKKIQQQAKERLSNPENNPMYGKHFSEESKEKLRKANMRKDDSVYYQSVPCYSPELDEQFSCSTEVKRKYGINDSHIRMCYNGQRKHAGRHPVTGELLTWLRLDDAINQGYVECITAQND